MDLSRVFRGHLDADRMVHAEVQRLYRQPPGFSTCLQAVSQILHGPRGSGKSMALRWLAYLDNRPREVARPAFYGVRLPIGRFQFDHFLQTYLRTGDAQPFFSYFNWYVLSVLLEDLLRAHWVSGTSFRLPDSFSQVLTRLDSPAAPTVTQDRRELVSTRSTIFDLIRTFKKTLRVSDVASPELGQTSSLDDTLSLLDSFSMLVEQHETTTLGLLIDGIDHLGDLGEQLAPLLSKDEPHSQRVIIKAACRSLPRYLYAQAGGPRLEEGRDYYLIPIGFYDAVDQYRTHLRFVMENRLEALLAPEDLAVRCPTIDEILPQGRSELERYTGFENLADFSAGNILIFLETCALALQFAQDEAKHKGLSSITPGAQRQAAKAKSRLYLDSDLDDQAGPSARDLKVMLDALGRHLKASPEQGLLIEADPEAFLILQRQKKLEISPIDAICMAVEFRYLMPLRAYLAPLLRRVTDSIPLQLLFSPTHAPAYDLPLASNQSTAIAVTANSLLYQVELKKRASVEQTTLLPQEGYAFLSVAGDHGGEQVKKKLDDAYRRMETTVTSVVTFREVSQLRTGRYLENLIDAIGKSRYVVLDITGGATSGVCVEIGIASGFRKPHSFLWLSDLRDGWKAPFNSQALPEELRGVDVKVWPPSGRSSPFYEWFRANVHRPTDGRSEMCGFRGSEATCDCGSVVPEPKSVFLHMQVANHALSETLIELLQARGIKVVCGPTTLTDPLKTMCRAIRGCTAALIDISRVDPKPQQSSSGMGRQTPRYRHGSAEVLPLMEVGYCLGAGIHHACLFDEGAGAIPSPMLPENRCSIPVANRERRLGEFVEWFMRTQLSGEPS